MTGGHHGDIEGVSRCGTGNVPYKKTHFQGAGTGVKIMTDLERGIGGDAGIVGGCCGKPCTARRVKRGPSELTKNIVGPAAKVIGIVGLKGKVESEQRGVHRLSW